MTAQRFPIRFAAGYRAMAVLGVTPGGSWVEVGDGKLRARMSWAFGLDVPLEHVRQARKHEERWSWGVHGWRGKWLVNGSSAGLVRIDLNPPARARTCGLPISVRELTVSVEDPDGLIEALRASGAAPSP